MTESVSLESVNGLYVGSSPTKYSYCVIGCRIRQLQEELYSMEIVV